MKHFLFLMALFCVSFGAQASSQQFNIQTKFSSSDVTVYSFEKPTVVSEKHDSKSILRSEITFKIKGILEGNLCEYKNTSLQVKYNADLSKHPNETFDVGVVAFMDPKKAIQMNDYVCPSYSEPTKFEMMTKVNPTEWSGSSEKTWTYRFENKFGANKQLVATLSKEKGWSWKFEQL